MGNGKSIAIRDAEPLREKMRGIFRKSIFSEAHWQGIRRETLDRFEVLRNACLLPAKIASKLERREEIGGLWALWIQRGLFKRGVMEEIVRGAIKVEKNAGKIVDALGIKYIEYCTGMVRRGEGEELREAAFKYLVYAAENGSGENKRGALKGVAGKIVRKVEEMHAKGERGDAMELEAEAARVLEKHLREDERKTVFMEALYWKK